MGRVQAIGAALLVLAAAAGCRKGEPQVGQRVDVQLTDQGFVPAQVTVRENHPVQLVITRTSGDNAAEVLLPDSGIRRDLPARQPITIEFTPREAGQIEFVNENGSFTGKVMVEPGM
jgi:plastocyanin domain-containing protein